MLLQEKKCTTEDIDRLLPYCWKQGEVVSTAATGTTGGLAILWNTNSLLLENFVTTKWSITPDYRLIGSNKPGHLTNVYGLVNPRDKRDFLRHLEFLSNLTRHNRWVVGGDFNLIRNLDEKKGDQDAWIRIPVTSIASLITSTSSTWKPSMASTHGQTEESKYIKSPAS